MEYSRYGEMRISELLLLYQDAGWTVYAADPAALEAAYRASLLTLCAREEGRLVGIVRLLGDGISLLLIQDLIVLSSHRRRGIGKSLLRLAEEEFPKAHMCALTTDATAGNLAFCAACGYVPAPGMGCVSMLKARPVRKSILVFIDGTIADDRHRLHLFGTEAFNSPEQILGDMPVPGSADCLVALQKTHDIAYIGARNESLAELTREWLWNNGFPFGEVLLSEDYPGRLARTREAAKRHTFAAGIGDRYDDSALHQELGIRSIILKEYEGDWRSVARWIHA